MRESGHGYINVTVYSKIDFQDREDHFIRVRSKPKDSDSNCSTLSNMALKNWEANTNITTEREKSMISSDILVPLSITEQVLC